MLKKYSFRINLCHYLNEYLYEGNKMGGENVNKVKSDHIDKFPIFVTHTIFATHSKFSNEFSCKD